MYNLFKGNVGLNKLKIIAKKIAINSIPGDVILLKGNLGSGKTTFARFFINTISLSIFFSSLNLFNLFTPWGVFF